VSLLGREALADLGSGNYPYRIIDDELRLRQFAGLHGRGFPYAAQWGEGRAEVSQRRGRFYEAARRPALSKKDVRSRSRGLLSPQMGRSRCESQEPKPKSNQPQRPATRRRINAEGRKQPIKHPHAGAAPTMEKGNTRQGQREGGQVKSGE